LRELFGIYNAKCPFALNNFATNNERGEQQPRTTMSRDQVT